MKKIGGRISKNIRTLTGTLIASFLSKEFMCSSIIVNNMLQDPAINKFIKMDTICFTDHYMERRSHGERVKGSNFFFHMSSV